MKDDDKTEVGAMLIIRLESERPNPNTADNMGMAVLHHAAALGLDEMMGVIIGIDLEPRAAIGIANQKGGGCTALHYAAAKLKVFCVKFMLEHAPEDVVTATTKDGNALHFAVAANGAVDDAEPFEEVFGILLDSALDPNVKNEVSCDTPLHVAARFGNVAAATLLIEYDGINLDIQNCEWSDTPLILAAKRRKWDVMRLLLKNGADKDIRNTDKQNGKFPEGSKAEDYVADFPEAAIFLDPEDVFRNTFAKFNVHIQLAPKQNWWSEGFEGFESDSLPSDSDIITIDAKRYRGTCENYTPGFQLDCYAYRKSSRFEYERECCVLTDVQSENVSGALNPNYGTFALDDIGFDNLKPLKTLFGDLIFLDL